MDHATFPFCSPLHPDASYVHLKIKCKHNRLALSSAYLSAGFLSTSEWNTSSEKKKTTTPHKRHGHGRLIDEGGGETRWKRWDGWVWQSGFSAGRMGGMPLHGQELPLLVVVPLSSWQAVPVQCRQRQLQHNSPGQSSSPTFLLKTFSCVEYNFFDLKFNFFLF